MLQKKEIMKYAYLIKHVLQNEKNKQQKCKRKVANLKDN